MTTQDPVSKRVESFIAKASEAMLSGALRRIADAHGRANVRAFLADFRARPDDIFIATYPRSGTTWMQMIVYQLVRGGGDLHAEHINQVCPWIERASVWGGTTRIDALQRFEELPAPRIFKTHLPYERIARFPARFIHVYRDGVDVAKSSYHFVAHGEPSFSDFFARHFLTGRVHAPYGGWFEHVSGWLANRKRRDVLHVRYEDLTDDLEVQLRRIADFLGLAIANNRWPEIARRCTFEAMKRDESKFDYLHAIAVENRRAVNGYAFLRRGATGEGRTQLGASQLTAYRARLARHGLLALDR